MSDLYGDAAERLVDGCVDLAKGALFCAAAAVAIGMGCAYYVGSQQASRPVTPGYVDTSKLEITVQDVDSNGSNEVLLQYDGKPYLFKVGENNVPYAQPFSVSEQKIKE